MMVLAPWWLLLLLFGCAVAPESPDDAERMFVLPSGAQQLTACKQDCSFHGICIDATCECDVGWSGEDCSYPVMAFTDFGIRSIFPPTGIALGGTTLSLRGFNFANTSGLSCRFTQDGNGTEVVVRARFVNSTFLECVAPPSALAPRWDPSTTALVADDTLSGGNGGAAASIAAAASPPGMPPLAPTPPPHSTWLRAALTTPDTSYTVEVAEEPPHFSNNGLRFSQWDAALISAQPAGGPIRGSTVVLLRGHGLRELQTGEKVRCRFGSELTLATLLDDGGAGAGGAGRAGGRFARCVSPRMAHAGVVPLSISLDSNGALGSMGEGDWTQPVEYVYHDVAVTSLLPGRGGSHEDFRVRATGLPLGVLTATLSANAVPMRELPSTAPASAHDGSSSASPPLGPLLVALEGLRLPLAAAAVETARGGGGGGGGGAIAAAELIVAGADCTMHALSLSPASSLGESGARATVLPGHAASSLGASLRAEGLTRCAPALGDLDGDGRPDLLIGSASGMLRAYRNLPSAAAVATSAGTGAATSSLSAHGAARYVPWDEQQQTAARGSLEYSYNPLGSLENTSVVAGSVRPLLVDVDADGDLDLFLTCGGCGGGVHSVAFYRNLGSRTRAFFVHVDVSSRSHPLAEFAARLLPIEPPRGVNDTVPAPPALAFGDVDGDGWPEAVLGGALLHLGPSFADEEVVAARTYAAFTIGASPEVSAGTGGHSAAAAAGGSLAYGEDSSSSSSSLRRGRGLVGGDTSNLESSAGDDRNGATPAVFGIPRLPASYARPNPLVDISFRQDEFVLIVDADGDGDHDILSLGSNTDMAAAEETESGTEGVEMQAERSAAVRGAAGVRLVVSEAVEKLSKLLKCKFGGSFEMRPCWSCDDAANGMPVPPHQVAGAPIFANATGTDDDDSAGDDAGDDAGEVQCVTPVLEDWRPARPRVYSGRFRVELSFEDQHWTQSAHSYEYVPPWRAVSVYPSAGPLAGGTFVQVAGSGLYAAATGEANPEKWRVAFEAHDANGDAQLSPAEFYRAIRSLHAADALPERTLRSTAEMDALAAAHDSNQDGVLAFDEYLLARPGGPRNASSPLPTLPPSWQAHCLFGPMSTEGRAGWTAAALDALVPAPLSDEWIGCHTLSAHDAKAELSLHQTFEPGESLAGWRVLALSNVPDARGGAIPPFEDVTVGLYSKVVGGALQLTAGEVDGGGTAIFSVPQPHAGAPHSPYFSATFSVHIGGGRGGEGLSFSYGEFADHFIDERGAGNGLRLQLRTSDIEQAAIILDGTTLSVTYLPSERIRGTWRSIKLSHTPAGLTVLLDRTVLFADLHLSGFRPNARWRMAFGARCSARHDVHEIDDVHVTFGAGNGQVSARLSPIFPTPSISLPPPSPSPYLPPPSLPLPPSLLLPLPLPLRASVLVRRAGLRAATRVSP